MPLGVHVLGGGFGESIILQLPSGKVGVIDCWSTRIKVASRAERLQANPTLRFLVQELRAADLAFVGLTHPHEDHGRGLSQVLAEYQDHVEQVWIFKGYQSSALQRFYWTLLRQGIRLAADGPSIEPPGSFHRELVDIRGRVIRQCDEKNRYRAEFVEFSGRKTLLIDGESVVFHFLGPAENLANAYEASLVDNLTGFVGEKGHLVNAAWKPDGVNHNEASPAILVEYGGTRILLGGDMEQRAWKHALGQWQKAGGSPRLDCQLVKASHHASANGFEEGFYTRAGAGGAPIIVVTPFNRNQSPLPSWEGYGLVRAAAAEVLTTNTEEARRALLRTALRLKDWPTELNEAIPPHWWDLPGALHPALSGQDPLAAAEPGLPLAWLADLDEAPWLAEVVHPALDDDLPARPGAVADVESACRLSFWFDDQGRELKERRFVGRLAGAVGFPPAFREEATVPDMY